MNLRKNILSALLIAIGFILHQIVPGVIGGMKFDIMLAMVFIILFINQDFKNALVTALLSGVITAMTTTFPGGQIPNIIDKLVTCIVVYFMIKIARKFAHKNIVIGVVSFVGTIVSGSVFLYSASILVGLPVPFKGLFMGIVLPTSVTNIFITLFMYKIVMFALKISRVKLAD